MWGHKGTSSFKVYGHFAPLTFRAFTGCFATSTFRPLTGRFAPVSGHFALLVSCEFRNVLLRLLTVTCVTNTGWLIQYFSVTS